MPTRVKQNFLIAAGNDLTDARDLALRDHLTKDSKPVTSMYVQIK